MQMQTWFAKPWPVAVDVVADDGKARRRGVHAQLMGAAGHRFHREPGKPAAAAEHLPVGDGFLSVRIRLLPPAALDIEPAERHFDAAYVLDGAAFDHRPIG